MPILPFLHTLPAQIQTPGYVQALPKDAEVLLQAKNWGGLADWFETVPPATRGLYADWWLQSLHRSGRWERLLTVCEALQPQLEAKTGPRYATYRQYRALALGNLGRHAEAAAAHLENGQLGDPQGFSNACTEARIAFDWPTLLAASEAILAKHPEHASGQAWRGEALARMDRFQEAEPVLRAAIAKDPSIAYAWNNLGRCLIDRKAWADAGEALDKALALEPGQLEALFNRGRARFELKRFAESRDDFRAALAIRPDDPVISGNLKQAERYAALPPPKPPKKR